MSLLPCLMRLAQLQSESVDRLALQEAAEAASAHENEPDEQLRTIVTHLQLRGLRWLATPDVAAVPALICFPNEETRNAWGILRGKNAKDQWVREWWDSTTQRWQEQADEVLPNHCKIALLRLTKPFETGASPVYRLVRQEILGQQKLIKEAILGGLMINVVALATSFYSMQVYDRVVPTGGIQTLLVLTMGTLAAIAFELIARRVRTGVYERIVDQVDQRLARTVYLRFLAIRLDQLPQSIGGLASQMRGYETVRGFFTSMTTSVLVDAPFAVIFAAVIAFIGGWLAAVPVMFFILSFVIALYFYRHIDSLATKSAAASNRKTGLLVETVEGAETIKSGHGGWRMLSQWMKVTDAAREYEFHMRDVSERTQHITAAFQQASYVLLVAFGALLVSQGELSMGGLIACSILSGRVLAPIAMIPHQMVQWAHARAALQGLDRLWELQDDHHGHEHPIVMENLQGEYQFESVVVRHGDRKALVVPSLHIEPGEKIGVLGPVGAGKTTFLHLLSGMYKPQEGRILLDDVDLAHIAKPSLAERLGYVQQDGRLFAGTLRDNLVLGLIDPGEEAILQAARLTGLLAAVIRRHPKGLLQEIFEGGTGLSGGQRQLVHLTRAFLRKPTIWLLDEPTASMDRNLEQVVTQALRQALEPQTTLVLVTHKVEMLELVDRLIVIANHEVILDGPKAHVLARLQNPLPMRVQAA